MHTHVLLSSQILAADIGGSHITAGICDLQTHRILPGSITRMDVDSKGTADNILTSLGLFYQLRARSDGLYRPICR